MSIPLVKNNLAVLRKRIENTSTSSELGRLEIAIALDMLSKNSISRAELNLITKSRVKAKLLKLHLSTDIRKLMASEAIPKILATVDPTSKSAGQALSAEILSVIPHFVASQMFAARSVQLNIETMWDIQSIADNFSKSPQQFNRLFADWRSWRIEADYGR
jgi:hypothetical protein